MDRENELRELIIAEAHKLLKTPFRHRGRTRHGLDCLGLCWLAYRRAGIEGLPDSDGKVYEPNWFWFVDKSKYLANLLKYFEYTDNPKIGDLVTFKCYKKIVTHAGIFDRNNTFIHCESGKCVDITLLNHRYWGSEKVFNGYLVYKGFLNS